MKPVTAQFQEAAPSRRRTAPTGRRLAVIAIAGVAATMAVSPMIARAESPTEPRTGSADEPFSLSVASHGKSVNASLGSFCSHEAGYCADAAYPLGTRGRLPVHPGSRITLRPDSSHPDVRASRVSVAIVRYAGDRREYTSAPQAARPTDSSRRAWVSEIPRRLHGARVLSVSVWYANGSDANFEAAFAPHRASVHARARSCRPVAFTPNSDDMAMNIRARGVGCAYARDFIRGFDTADSLRYRGYTCTSRSVETEVSIAADIRCTRGTRIISWRRL